jgi:hypothetical protein
MTNTEVVNAFVDVLLRDPDPTMHAVALRLSATDYEMKLLHADPCKVHWEAKGQGELFPMHTGERNIWEVND